ncbi:MAG: hypothetical protein WC711_00860 [Candidatus Staskawiczbacteria bacterium]|jgi:adenine-specific DNA methylase
MAIQDPSDQIKSPEKISEQQEQVVPSEQEVVKAPEKGKVSEEDKIIAAELRREIEKMELNPDLAKEVEVQKEKLEYLGEQGKIQHLLELAKAKGGREGLVFAVQTAKTMNEPYLLDLLHDVLVSEGLYQKLEK